MEDDDLYILAVRVNGDEYIANFEMHGKVFPVHYSNLEEAKNLFEITYKILSAGPGQNTKLFAKQFERMAIFRPVYVKVPKFKSIDIIKAARADNEVISFDEISLLMQPLCYFKVKRGFIEKYLALDILKDIEGTLSVGPEGKIIVNQFNIRNPYDDSLKDDEKPRDPDEMLRRRGLI